MARKRKKNSPAEALEVQESPEFCDLTVEDGTDGVSDSNVALPMQKNTRRRKALAAVTNEAIHVFEFSADDKICFTAADIRCLDEGSLLNDTVVDFYCRWIERKADPEALRKGRVHIFTSFLYQKLLLCTDSKPLERETLAKWTKGVNIFEKEYLVFPVCEKLHWYKHASNEHMPPY
jgi:Ulp1 family protease